MFIIMLITVVLAFFYNQVIDCLKLHERQFFEVEYKNQSSNDDV